MRNSTITARKWWKTSIAVVMLFYCFTVWYMSNVHASLFSPQDVPGPPEKILLFSAGESAIRVQFLPPEHTKAEGNNGAPVIGYKVEVAQRVNEVQTFTVEANGPVLSGSYKMTFTNIHGTDMTSCIPWNASEVVFETALEELLNIDNVSVTRSAYGAAPNGYVYTIVFDGPYLVNGKQQVLVGDQDGCQTTEPLNRIPTFTGARVTVGAQGYYAEVWEIITSDTASTNIIGGTFDLSLGFEGDWEDSGVTATIVPGSKMALTDGTMVGKVNRGDPIRIGNELFVVHASAQFTDEVLPLDSYHIRGAPAGTPIYLLDTAMGDVAVGQYSQTVYTASSFEQDIVAGDHVKLGDWEFEVTSVSSTEFTIDQISSSGYAAWPGAPMQHLTAYKRKKVNMPVNAEAADVKKALNGLPGFGSVDVTRAGPTKVNGYTWYVTFMSLGIENKCPESPCLRADIVTGDSTLKDVYGNDCSTCIVTASLQKDKSSTLLLSGLQGEYADNSIVTSQEVSGVVHEVQSISTFATVDNIRGSFAVNFRNSFSEFPGVVISYDDTAVDVQTKLQNLPATGRLNVTRTDNAKFGMTWTVTFLSNNGDLPLFIIDKQLLTGTGVDVVVEEVVKGIDVPFEAVIDGLTQDREYYVRAFAKNIIGYGAGTDLIQEDGKGALPLSTYVGTSPDAPQVVGMWPISGSQVGIRFTNPAQHGDPVQRYIFEYALGDSFGVSPVKEIFVYNALENDITGTFQLQYGDQVTPLLSAHVTAADLRDALNGLNILRPVSVTRAVYVLTGDTTSNRVISFSVVENRLTTSRFTEAQSRLLVAGSAIDVGGNRFVVKTQPSVGSAFLDVELGHSVANDFTYDYPLLKLDESGSEQGPSGYQWTISFTNEVDVVYHARYPGLQLLSALASVEDDTKLTSIGIRDAQVAVPTDHYGSLEISNDDATCDTYVVGASSAVQVIQLFAPTTITAGTFKLRLGAEITDRITLGNQNAPSTMKHALETLDFVSKVTVEEQRLFKVNLLTGSSSSKVTDFDGISTLSITIGTTGLTPDQAAALPMYTIIQVSRNPNDFSRHSCEFVVQTDAVVSATTLDVTPVGTCTQFSLEARTLKILDFHDYKIRFWGYYPTGHWPTLQIVPEAFGYGPDPLDQWTPAKPVYSEIHTVKYEGVCGQGHRGFHTILVDAATEIGGTFTLSYLGQETRALSFQATTAAVMRDAIVSITGPGMVNVSLSKYGSYGKAWHITFTQEQEDQDTIFIKHAFLTGQEVTISVYPTVEVFTDARKNDISGTFQLAFQGLTTEPISFAATHKKVVQELQKLSVVDSVIALGSADANDMGVYPLELQAAATNGASDLTDVQLNGVMIDPTHFLAIGEKLVINGLSYFVQSLTQVDITIFPAYTDTNPGTVTVIVFAGLITRQTKPLPGYVDISHLTRVITATKDSYTIELPAGHGFVLADTFYINGQEFTVRSLVTDTTLTTYERYTGDNIVAASPEIYIFDNKLRTTEDLRQLVTVDDDLWLDSGTNGMAKYNVKNVDARFILVDGIFTDTIIKGQAYHVSNGRKWSLIFKSYLGDLDTFDAQPLNDWRGTDARIGTRHSKAAPPQVINVGNPASTQTVLLEALSAVDLGNLPTYCLIFGDETTTDIAWTAVEAAIEEKLEALDGIDGVTVTSQAHDNGFVHSISFWGMYAKPTLPLLQGKITHAAVPDNLAILVRSNNAVAVAKQDNLILQSNQDYLFRFFAINAKGISDSSKYLFQTHTSLSSIIPSPPTSVCLGEYHGSTWLTVNYRPPFYTGGAPVTMYRLEWDSSPAFDSSSVDYGVATIQKRFEVQQVTTSYRSDTNAGGTFTLSWGGRTTTALAVNCTSSEMADALAVITDTANIAIDPVKVTRTRASWGYSWKITFLHNPGDLALLVADGSLMTGNFPQITVTELVSGFADMAIGDFTHEVQDVFTDAKTLLSGSFKLIFEGRTSKLISVDASALEMQEILQATTASYSIKVSKSWRNQVLNTAIWSVSFAYLRGEEMVGAGNILTMSVDSTSVLTGTGAVVRVADKVSGSDPFRYTITGLRMGVKYYMHAMAYNAEGFGSATSPLSSAVTCGQPDPPQSVVASVVDGTTLAVTWTASASNGGCEIDKYKVEWYRAEGIREQQTITTSAAKGIPEIQRLVTFADSQSISGFFRLSFNGETTENVQWNASATGQNSIKERLERLATVGTVDVSRQQSTRVVSGLMVTATGYTLTRNAAASTVTIASTGLEADDEIWILGKVFKINAVVDANTMTVNDSLITTVPVPIFTNAFGFQWQITFLSGHVGPQPLLKVYTSDSWAGKNPGIYVDSIQKGMQPISGTFCLSFASGGLSHTTLPIPYNASADELKESLEGLVTIGLVNVTRSQNGYGYNWIVTFLTELKQDITLLGVDGTELHGPSVKILAVRTNMGTQPSYYCEKNGVAGVPAEISQPGDLRYVIPGLKSGQSYAIRVRAHNSEGYGGAAYITPSFQTPRTKPSIPKDATLLVLSSRYFKVRWNAPDSDGGSAITSYKVQWDTSSSFANIDSPYYDFQGEVRVQSGDSSPFFFNIPIRDVTNYFVRIIAMNDQGESAASMTNPRSAIPLDRTPGQPENVVATVLSSYAILVSWESSSTEKSYFGGNGGLPITQYMVEWDNSAAFDSPASFGLVDGNTFSFIIGGNDVVTGVRSTVLIPDTTYSIRVTAFNAKGAGTPRRSYPPYVVVTSQVPTEPRDLKLSVISSTSIKADWVNPLYDGGSSLTSYQVEWDEQEDFSSGQSSSATIPIVREMQSVTVSTDVVNEEQFVDATVEVVNEQQVVRTIFTGADEIQTIQTNNDRVIDEVQMIVTNATDRNEVQELRVDGSDVNEIQAIRSTIDEILEVQSIQVGAVRVNEVQTIAFTITGTTNKANIGGDLYLTFNNTNCAFCNGPIGFRRTTNLISALQASTDSASATAVQLALIALDNIDDVTVACTSATATNNADLNYIFSITFSGNDVTGNVPELQIENSITVSGNSISGIPTKATEATTGNEVTYDAASFFSVTYTCESYSDPNSITSFKNGTCDPPISNQLCASCVTAFTGSVFSVSQDLRGSISVNDQLIAGVCVFQVGAISSTDITVLANDVGNLCGVFTAKTKPLYKAQKRSTNVPLKISNYVITPASVVEGLLTTLIDSVTVTSTKSITSNFVGTVYAVTFRKRTGSPPLLVCKNNNIGLTNLQGTSLCQVTQTTIGSMISGTFTVGLTPEAGGTAIQSGAIAWDASEQDMKQALEAVVTPTNDLVFGTVNIKRSVYAPTGNKWSGSFTWQIEFTSRGWNIPKIEVVSSLVNSNPSITSTPTILVEDADNLLSPTANSRHGNEIGGSMTFKFNNVVATIPCVIGTHTSSETPHIEILDTKLSDFLTTYLGSVIPTVEVTRSACTQAKGFTWKITFSDKATGGDIDLLRFYTTALTGIGANATVVETIKGNQLGGTFQLTFNGETTGPILFSADKSAVEAQLNSLSSIKPSSVKVDRVGPAITDSNQVLSYTWYVTFYSSVWADPTSDHSNGIVGNWKGAKAKWNDVWETGYSKAWGRHVGPMGAKGFNIFCTGSGLTTTANDNSQVCQVSVKTPGVGPIKGTFAIKLDSTNAEFMSVRDSFTSSAIAHNAWASKMESGATGTSVEEILEKMANVGNVSVTRSDVDVLTGGYTWTVTFLRDKVGSCDQVEDSTDAGVRLCNSPGDVPTMQAIATSLSGSNPIITVSTIQDGQILRGDFTKFQVPNDPGFGARYQVKIVCPGGENPPCNTPIQNLDIVVGAGALQKHLLVGDRFTIGTYTTCIFTVVDVTDSRIEVTQPSSCGTMGTNTAMGVNIRLPWNATENLVQRVLEASADTANERDVWIGGRKVSVQRTIHGKYGEVSWQIRFISNPTFTPPGAGNIADIETTFQPTSVAVSNFVTVTQLIPGSTGLSGSFLIDFHSTFGPREISFDENEERLQRKLNEMNTIGRVMVKRLKYPSTATGCRDSSCSGGWDDQPVDIPGTRGGYRWQIRFMKVTGEYGGLTYPPGSGNVGPLTVSSTGLSGNEKSIDVSTNMAGSMPMLGGFALTTASKSTPLLPYSSSSDTMKQGIESMNLFGEVDITNDYLLTQQIPNAVATISKDDFTATIRGVDDIRQFVGPGDVIRFGPTSANNLAGSNGDSPFTSVLATSNVAVSMLSPIVSATPTATKLLYPDMTLRIDGLVYTVQRSGQEIQTVTVMVPIGVWDISIDTVAYYRLKVTRAGKTSTTACLFVNEDPSTMELELEARFFDITGTTQAGEIKVSQAGPITSADGNNKGYVYSIYFQGDSVAGDVAMLQTDFTGCTPITNAQVTINVVTHGGRVGVQRLSLATDSGQVVDSTGYFKMTLNSQTTECLKWGLPASDLEKQLEDSAILNAGNVIVVRRGSGISVTEIQRLRMTSNTAVTSTTTDLFQIVFTLDGKTAATDCLRYGISAEDLQVAINQLSILNLPVTHVNVTREGDGTSMWGYGYEYLIHFDGPIEGGYSPVLGNMNLMEVVNVGKAPCTPLSGGTPALIMETVREGSAGYSYDIFFMNYPTAYTPLITLQHESTSTCDTGWVHNGGSSRKALVELITLGGSAEVQTLIIKDTTNVIPAGTSFTLSLDGITETSCLQFDSDPSDVQTALNNLIAIGTDEVFVSYDIHPVIAPHGSIYKITFVGELVTGSLPLLQVSDTACSNKFPATSQATMSVSTYGGTSPGEFALTSVYDGEKPGTHIAYSVSQLFSVLNEQIEVQQIVVSNPSSDIDPAAGAYTLTLRNLPSTSIRWNAAEDEVESAIAGVNAGDVIVTRRTDRVLALNGYVYTVYFSGASVSGNLGQMVATPSNFGTDGRVEVTTLIDGVDGVSLFQEDSIPLAKASDPNTAARFLANDRTDLSIFKVNGFLWTIKFKSTIGNIPKLGVQTDALVGKVSVLDDFVAGQASNSYVMTNLLSGITFYVRVAASTDIGTGGFTSTASIIPSGTASPVLNIAAGYALSIREVQEVRLAATHITEIQAITTSCAAIAEVQTLRTFAASDSCIGGNCISGGFAFRVPTVQTIKISALAPITAGTFTIGFYRNEANSGAFRKVGTTWTTNNIPWNAQASDVLQEMTTRLDAIDPGDIIVTRDGDGSADFEYGFVFSITFVGNNVAGETSMITVTPSGFQVTGFQVTGSDAYSITVDMNSGMSMGTDTEVQQVIVNASKPLVAGSYRLVFDHLGASVRSDCIQFDAPARDNEGRSMEMILKNMPNIDTVYVTRTVDPKIAPYGFIYHIFFYGNGVYGDVNILDFDFDSTVCTPFQTQENNVLTTTGVNGEVIISVVDEGGFNSINTFVNAASATAAQLEQDLGRLPIFGDVIASRSLADEQGGFIWTVAFKDSEGDLPQFICAVDSAFKSNANAGCETATPTDGNVLSGSFMIESSAPISFDASAATVKSALEAMSWVGTVQVLRSDPSPQRGYTWTITFMDYFGDVPSLVTTSSLVGTGSSIQVYEIRKGNTISGTFTLSYLSSTTAPISWNAKATALESGNDKSSMQEILEALDTVGPVSVQRSSMDREGGYSWLITFLDNKLNPGDVPLLRGNASALTGVSATVFTREVVKGSNAVGDQLWLSFDPPMTDNGSPITKYLVRWDTSATFTAAPAEFAITEPEKLYQIQRVVTTALSLTWSSLKTLPVMEVQSLTILSAGSFTLSFRGATTASLTVGTSTSTSLTSVLNTLSTISAVIVTPGNAAVIAMGSTFQITFTDEQGDLPELVPDNQAVAAITEVQKGVTNFRKEVVVFSCSAGAGKVTFTVGTTSRDVDYNADLATVETELHKLFNVEAESIRVTSIQLQLCASNPLDITIVFDRVYGNIDLGITSTETGTPITTNSEASIDGIYNDNPDARMSGTFRIGYKESFTRSLNAESTADDVRYALEDLTTIQTVGVTREWSFQPLPGKVDVTNGTIFVTCSTNETCNFHQASYGLPGYIIRIGGAWYTIRTDTVSDALDKTRLYLGDLNGREVGYSGKSATGVTVYEWTKGYVWTVTMLNVAMPLGYLRAKIPRLYPLDSTVTIMGSSCDKCYYLATQTTKKLTMGQEYFIEVYAFNENGKGQAPVGRPVRATPSQVPNAPSNVDLAVVSGTQLEVFFSPPALSTTNVSPNFNNDISSYIVQWDTDTQFRHGRPICMSCATSLDSNTLKSATSLKSLVTTGTSFTIADENCVLEISAIDVTFTTITVATHHCHTFNARMYALYYYTYEPAVLSDLSIQGSPPFRYLISQLEVGKQYYVRVAAMNSVPVQQIALDGNPPDNRKWSYPLVATTKDTVPDPPISVYLYPFSGTTLEVQIQPPTRDGKGTDGDAITYYWIDVDTVSTFDSNTKSAPVNVSVTGGTIPELYTGGPRVYYIKNLNNGVRYFVQVKAINSIGYSRATIAPNPLAPTRNPDGPVNVKVTTKTSAATPIDSITVTWQNPVFDGGLALTSYKVEWWSAESRPEIQVIEVTWTTAPTAARFKLSYGGGQSAYIPHDVSPENLRNALMNIIVGGTQLIHHVAVSKSTINVNQGYQWRVTFANTFNTGDLPLIQFAFEPNAIVGGTNVAGRVFEATPGIAEPQTNFPGKPEIQVLVTSHPSTTVGGYFRLSYKGSAWSNYLSATVTAADLQLALQSLPTIGRVSVNFYSGSNNGQIWTITFESNVGNVPSFTVDSSKITPSDAFVGVKDGDNAVDSIGRLCMPGQDICSGIWTGTTAGIADLAEPGETAMDYGFYETIDASTLTYKITGLTPGKEYFVAVTAKNALGLGARVKSTPTSIMPPVQVPGPPTGVGVDVNPNVATQLTATWSAPLSDGGGVVRMYRVEYDPSPLFKNRGQEDFWCPAASVNAVWTVQTYLDLTTPNGNPIGDGYFKLQLRRNNLVRTTEPIPWNAVATAAEEIGDSSLVSSKVFCTDCQTCDDTCPSVPSFPFSRREHSGSLQSKLEYLDIIDSVQITRSVNTLLDGGYTWTITFLDGGNDFRLDVLSANNMLTCSNHPNCASALYGFSATQITVGMSNSACTGSKVIPSIGALVKGQLYNVRVFAYNKIGFSLPATAPSPQKPMVVPGPPTGVTLVVVSVSELKVIFSPPDDDGGDTIVAYQVQWSTDSGFTNPQSAIVSLLSGGAPYSYVISGLVKGTFYFVRVQAKNSQGFGTFQISSPTSLNPYTSPSAPTQVSLGVTSSTMLTVQWNVPNDNGGDAITGYIVQWDTSANFDSFGVDTTKAIITDTTQRSYTITLLTPSTMYYVRVFATNMGGAGTPQTSIPTYQIPANTRPGKPHSLKVAPTGTPNQLLVEWQSPTIPAHKIPCSGTLLSPQSCPVIGALDAVFGGSTLESYMVHWSDSTYFTGFSNKSVTDTSALLTGLDSGKTYYVRVLAVNSQGLKGDFCERANKLGYLCPDNLVLLDGTIVTGDYVSAIPA